jgi:hypothetical protein
VSSADGQQKCSCFGNWTGDSCETSTIPPVIPASMQQGCLEITNVNKLKMWLLLLVQLPVLLVQSLSLVLWSLSSLQGFATWIIWLSLFQAPTQTWHQELYSS